MSAGTGANLVLVPGFMADATLWDAMRPALALLGTLHDADLGQDGSIAAMAARAVAAVPGPLAVLGFSMGGYVGREIVRLAPDRVRALVLVATSCRADTPAQARAKAAALARMETAGFAGLSRRAAVSSLHPRFAEDAAMIERVRGMGLRLGAAVFARQSRLARDGDGDRLAAIACPTLVVAATEDRLRSRAEAEELAAGIPGARLEVVAQAGHMLPLERPEALEALIVPWLRGHLAG